MTIADRRFDTFRWLDATSFRLACRFRGFTRGAG
jgi:hypothetical protein